MLAPPAAGRPADSRAALLMLGALGTAFLATIGCLAAQPDWFHYLGRFQLLVVLAFVLFALALGLVRRTAHDGRALAIVLGVAVLARALLLPLTPSLSGDVYRYLWEGRVLVGGGDPYRQSPSDPALRDLRDDVVWPQINHPELSTIYPPLAEAGFALVARVWPTVPGIKLWVVLHDLVLVGILAWWSKRERGSGVWVLAYAWNPLVLVEYAGSGHNDPTSMVWLALALMLMDRKPMASAVAASAAVLTKLVPLVAIPFLLMRWPWRARLLALTLIGTGLGWFWLATRATYSGLTAYWGRWRNNELVFHYLDRLLGNYATARTVGVLVVLGLVAWALARRWPASQATRAVMRGGMLVTPVLHPWYLGWELMFQPLQRSWVWLLGSLFVVLNYGVGVTPAEGRAFHLPLAWRWLEYGAPALLACGIAWATWRARHRSGA